MRVNAKINLPESATAYDDEDGEITANLLWTSGRDGPIGTGGAFSRSDLSVGVHSISSIVVDSAGRVAIGTIDGTIWLTNSTVLVDAGDSSSCDTDNEENTAL